MTRPVTTIASIITMAGLAVFSVTASAAAAPATSRHHGGHAFHVDVVLNGADLKHKFVAAGSKKHKTEPLSFPDDLTQLNSVLFTAFQNGVGPQGQASTSGNRDSTIVEFTAQGTVVHQWNILGKCDGLTADPKTGLLIATVNEDANSSIYTIKPVLNDSGGQVKHYHYNRPLASNGGTDAISIYHGLVLISASAPGTTGKPAPQKSYPAVYIVTFENAFHTAVVKPLFYDVAKARVANVSPDSTSRPHRVLLGLTDPDSNEVVPTSAARFRGDFMLTSQGDMEQIFVENAHTNKQKLLVLKLTQSVDDTAWPTSEPGSLYAADTSGDTVDVVTGPFQAGAPYVAVTPCDANGAPATCPAPDYPPNYLGVLDPYSGVIYPVPTCGATLEPQGMLWVLQPVDSDN